jgi:hypothetical protein
MDEITMETRIGVPVLNWLTSGAVEAILNHWRHKKP